MIKHIPLRKCVACGERFPQKTMIKVTKTNDSFFIDETQKQSGRGAYVCKTAECISIACKKRQLNRSFSANVPNEIYEQLAKYIDDGEKADE